MTGEQKLLAREEEQREFLQHLIDGLPLGICVKSAADGFRCILWNSRQEEMTGISTSKAFGRSCREIYSDPVLLDMFESTDHEVLKTGRPVDYVISLRVGDAIRPVHVFKSVFSTGSGEKLRRMILTVGIDLSRWRKLERSTEKK